MPKTGPEDVSALLLDVYRHSHELPLDRFNDAALVSLREVLPFDASMWGSATYTPTGIDIHSIHLHRKSPQMLIDYEEVKHLDHGAAAVVGHSRATAGFHTSTLYGEGEALQIRDFCRRHEHRNIFITAQTDLATGFVHWVSLFRSDEEAHCSERERRLLALLAPHFMQAQVHNRERHLERAASEPGTNKGLALTDLRGVVHHETPKFAALRCLEWNSTSSKLPSEVMACFLAGEPIYKGREILVEVERTAGVLIVTARQRTLVDLLTARELAIANLVRQGFTYREIATMSHRAPATIRNQIQSIYRKLEVDGIATLITRLLKTEC